MRTVDHILISALLGALLPDASARASDDPAQNFVEEQHHRLEHLLHAPASSSSDAQVRQALGGFVDYDDLTRRAFGEPCPSSQPSCEDLWAGYDDGQHAELRGLMEQLDVTYRGTRDVGGDTRVLTEAKDRGKPREPAVRVDYVVKQTKNGLKVVDVITEGSSMAKAYYEQFRKKMHDPNEGYPNIVQKLRDKIAKTP
jgi:hypothetical protein